MALPVTAVVDILQKDQPYSSKVVQASIIQNMTERV